MQKPGLVISTFRRWVQLVKKKWDGERRMFPVAQSQEAWAWSFKS